MENKTTLARKKKRGRKVLLVGEGTTGVVQTSSRRVKRKKETRPSKEEARKAVKATATKGKDSPNAKARDGEPTGRTKHGHVDKVGKPARGTQGGDKASRRSATDLGIVWIDNRCEESPTKAHYSIGGMMVDMGTIFECKYCHRMKWLPNTFQEVMTLGNLQQIYGLSLGYQKMLDKHPTARGLVAKIQDLYLLRKSVPEEHIGKVIAAVMTDGEYPYETEHEEEEVL